jgi:CRISPR-associated protein Cas2
VARRRYLVAYDIADPIRLRRTHATVKGFGFALQYSVFVCDLDAMEKTQLRAELGEVIHHTQDRVAIIDLGDPAQRGVECFEFMGNHPVLPSGGPTIV